jgi:hypothetical protein
MNPEQPQNQEVNLVAFECRHCTQPLFFENKTKLDEHRRLIHQTVGSVRNDAGYSYTPSLNFNMSRPN